MGNVQNLTDNRRETYTYGDNINMSHGEHLISNEKNFSQATPNGTAEWISASSTYIDGNINYLASAGQMLADTAKAPMVAARSQPETQPDPTGLSAMANLLKPNGNVLKRAATGMVTEDEIKTINEAANSTPSFASNILTDIAKFIGQYTAMFSVCSAKGAQQVATIYAKDVQNNVANQKKNIEEMAAKAQNTYSADNIMEKIKSGDISELLKPPSTENAPKVACFDEDEYQNKIAECLPEIIAAERLC